MKCWMSGTASESVLRSVLYLAMSSAHVVSYLLLGAALLTYDFSSFSTVLISAKRLAKLSAEGKKRTERR
jgi:hypothetical protein